MPPPDFQASDRLQFEKLGITPEAAQGQLELLRRGVPFLQLHRPCRIGDGIRRLSPSEKERLVNRFSIERAKGRAMKFVPASGAASRMFKDLQAGWHAGPGAPLSEPVKEFFQSLDRFGFAADLKKKIAEQGLDLAELLQKKDFHRILELLLTRRGLNYAATPKALISFHAYPGGPRTALEEHLREGELYLSDAAGRRRFHVTFSWEHEAAVREFLKTLFSRNPEWQQGWELGISFQSPGHQTLALDGNGLPFRDAQGQLLFRPGGHGALLKNLQESGGDLVFLQNIDNVAVASHHVRRAEERQILGGLLVELQDRCHTLLTAKDSTDEARQFLEEDFSVRPAFDFHKKSRKDQVEWLRSKLRRPIRVAGMVPNRGEVGGGPFWVQGVDGSVSLQIVESSQIDSRSEEQQQVFRASTHFNPVDLVCATRDEQGRAFDLTQFSDPQTAFISQKSHEGRPLLALEWPGLWNGAMADWNTVFVEVPGEIFTPVKTVMDLLRPEHQGVV